MEIGSLRMFFGIAFHGVIDIDPNVGWTGSCSLDVAHCHFGDVLGIQLTFAFLGKMGCNALTVLSPMDFVFEVLFGNIRTLPSPFCSKTKKTSSFGDIVAMGG